MQTTPGGRRAPHGNPLHLVNKKAKELAGLLGQNGSRVWVGAAVCFSDSSLRVRLPAHDQNGVYTIDLQLFGAIYRRGPNQAHGDILLAWYNNNRIVQSNKLWVNLR